MSELDKHPAGTIVAAIEGADEWRPKPRLLVDAANPNETVAALRDILAAAGGLYERGIPVRLVHDQLLDAMTAHPFKAKGLIRHTHEVCRPYIIKINKDGDRDERDAPFPTAMAEMYLEWRGAWNLPVLNGIARSPLLRPDGSFHAVEGYDQSTGLWCERVPDLAGLVLAEPTRDDAAAALRLVRNRFGTFCFADAVTRFDPGHGVEVIDTSVPPGKDESAFLAALLTGVCRASLPLAPGIIVRAAPLSGAGAGKGLLARCIALIAFGREPHAVSGGSGQEELDKRIAAELIGASPVLLLDNLNSRNSRSDLLASVLPERPTRVRILGRSEMMPLNASALVLLTGDGLMLSEDLARHFLVIELDPRTEDPESRPFRPDIKAACLADRSALLSACLTIWRWGRIAEPLPRGLPIGSFERWSAWVRDPLLALGCQDPVARISETKARDSQRAVVLELFELWWARHGNRPVAARDLAEDVVQALNPDNRGRQWVGSRLEKLSGTRMAGYVLERQAADSKWGVARYRLERTGEWPGAATPRPYDPYGSDGFRLAAENKNANAASDAHEIEQQAEKHRTHRGHRGLQDPSADDSVDTPRDKPSATDAELAPLAIGWRKRL